MAAAYANLIGSARLLASAGLIAAPMAVHSQTSLHPHQQWVCNPVNGGWGCQVQAAAPGAYPQAPLPDNFRNRPLASAVSSANVQELSPKDLARQWDWVPYDQLEEADRCHESKSCGGQYIEPPRDWEEADQEPALSALRASADETNMEGDTVHLRGNIQLTKGSLSTISDRASYDRASGKAEFEGNVTLRQPGLLIRGSRAEFDTSNKTGSIENAYFVQHASGARGTAQRITRPSDQEIILSETVYTQCTPQDNAWVLAAKEIEIDNATGWGKARSTAVKVKGVPVFYSPYMTFPVDDRRMSGFLWPTIASDSSGGVDVAIPYYWNIAPNYDLTFTPRFVEDRGAMAELETRYLNRTGEWVLSGTHLADDKITESDRWLGSLQQTGSLMGSWRTRIDYTKVSDNDYFKDLNLSSLDIKRETHLNQTGSISYLGDSWSAELEVERYQTIAKGIAEPYRKLPSLTVEKRTGATNFGIDPIFLAEWTEFDHADSIEEGGTRITGSRLYSEAGFSLPMEWMAGFILPSAKMRHVSYELDDTLNPTDNDSPDASAPLYSLDMGLFFEREFDWDGDGFIQTLEPRIFYLYSEFEDQSELPDFDTSALTFSYNQLFRDRRFSGRDRIEDFDQASVGITSRFIESDTGNELITLSIGQIFYFEDRQIHLGNATPVSNTVSNSTIATEISYQPSNSFWATTSLLWDSNQDKLDEGGVMFHYRSGNDGLFNLGYRYRRDPSQLRTIEQGDISMVLPLGNKLRLFTRWNYDFQNDLSLEETAGLEYSSCCWSARLLYQSAVEESDLIGTPQINRDHALLLEFQLKGLGNTGRRVDSLLRESIFGYEELER